MGLIYQNFQSSTRNHPTGNGFPLANSGQIVTESVEIIADYDFTSSLNEQILIVSDVEIRLLGGDWSDKGLVVGDSVALTFSVSSNGTTISATAALRNVTAINGDTITVDSTLDPTSSGIIVGQTLPFQAGPNSNTALTLTNLTRSAPEVIEFFHNLTPNAGNGSEVSLFDGSVNRFEALGISALAVLDPAVTAVQQGNKSGGSYISATVQRIADSGTNKRYKIELRYANPYKFTDSVFTEPALYANTASVKPFYSVRALSQENNPNAVLVGDYAQLLGNYGWRDESYNQGVNEFTVESVTILGNSGTVLSEVDPTQNCTLTAVISHGSLDFFEFAECEFYLIPDVNTIKNIASSNAENIQLSNFSIDSGSLVDAAAFGTGGALMSTANHAINITPQQITVQFDLQPNAAFSQLVDSFATDSRRYVITANVESTGGNANANNAVTLTLKEGILEEAPVLGELYPVKSQGFYNHSQDLTGTSELTYRGCTEDDMLYQAVIDLEEGKTWQGINLAVQVVKDSDGTSFDLLERYVNLNNFLTNSAGAIQINYNEALAQYLESPSRNALNISLTGNDGGGFYEVKILWSLLASWRYWLPQNNAFIEFLDLNIENDGRNNEWVRYLELSGFSLRVRVELIDENNVADFFGAAIALQDYDSSLDVTTTIEYYDSSGTQQTSWITNDVMTVRAIHTLNSGTWPQTDTWGWLSLRPFESEPNKRISTVWDWTAQNYPLQPKSGATKATLTFPSANVAHVEALVNTNMINTETSTVVARIETPKAPACELPFAALFDQAKAASDTPDDLLVTLRLLLNAGIVSQNICCPTCTVRLISTGQDVELYAFGRQAKVQSIISDVDGDVNPICCTDVYGVSAGCEATFDATWDAFMLEVTGDTAGLTLLKPSQINAYSGTDLAALSAAIQALTPDENIRFEIIELLVNNGIKVVCANGSATISFI